MLNRLIARLSALPKFSPRLLVCGIALAVVCGASVGRGASTDSDLLDPSQLGLGRKHAASDGLLAPPRPGAATVPLAVARSNRPPPSYAREMADRVVSSLDGLTGKAAELLVEIKRLEEAQRLLAQEIQTLVDSMAAEMNDYRNGLFCSGCNRTRTAILAMGDTFPHPGQHVIRATPEQIAAKEKELQAPIDRKNAELLANVERLKRLKRELDEAIDQIDYGISLWRTSAGFEQQLINGHEADSIAAFQAVRTKIDGQVSKLQADIRRAKDKATVEALTAESALWNEQLAKLGAQRREARHEAQIHLARARQRADDECGVINSYIMRGTLGQHVARLSVASTTFLGGSGGFNALGGLYRLGDASPARHDEVLPSVRTFVETYQLSPSSGGDTLNN